MTARLHRPPGRTVAHLMLWCWALLLGSGLQVAAAQAPGDTHYAEQVAQLATAGFGEKGRIVDALLEARHPQTRMLLAAFLDGRLASRKSDGKVFITEDADDGVALVDPVDASAAGTAKSSSLRKIGTNNRLRKKLKGAIALFDLDDADAGVRLAAVDEMLRELDATTVSALRTRLGVEDSARVRRALEVGLALADLSSSDAEVRLAAVGTLEGELGTAVYNRLKALERDEADARVRDAAVSGLRHIDQWRRFYGGVETLFFGLSLGSVLVLAAIGLAITFGVMGVINMAHGELMMIGAYTAYVMQLLLPQHTTLAVLLAVPAAFLVSGLVGVGIERGIVRFLYGRPLETLLATFGLSLILQQAVRSIFSPLNRSVATPEFMSGSWQINEVFSLTWNRLYIVIFALLVFALLQLVLNKTSLGLKVRAVSQNREMARALGVRSARVDAMTFGLGAGVAGVAGVALSQLTNVGPNLGQSYIVDSFMVVVFGGVGNLWGTLIGGMSLGVVNKLLEPWSGAVMAKILVLVFLILFIQRRPRGLFPHKGRAAEGH